MLGIFVMSDRMLLSSRPVLRSRGRISGKVIQLEFNPGSRIVSKRGSTVQRLTPQQTQVLGALAGAAPGILSLKDLEKVLWPSAAPNNSPQRLRDLIKDLRAVLGDSAEAPRWIDTVPGTGYTFVGTMEPVAAESSVTDERTPDSPSVCESKLYSQPPNVTEGTARLVRPVVTFAGFALLIFSICRNAYGAAVAAFCVCGLIAVCNCLDTEDTMKRRIWVSVFAIAAMAYIPSAATLTPLISNVVNMTAIPPAVIYPFITGMKFIPLWVVVFAYWIVCGSNDRVVFTTCRLVRVSYFLAGPLVLGLTCWAIVSNDGRLWSARLAERWTILFGYAVVLGGNLIVWALGANWFTGGPRRSSRTILAYCAVPYLLVVFAAVHVDATYHSINEKDLDCRRPQAYAIGNPEALAAISKESSDDCAADLQALLSSRGFQETVRTRRFYKQDFDEPFQLRKKAIMFGYRSTSDPNRFTIVRLPLRIAAALRFEPVNR